MIDLIFSFSEMMIAIAYLCRDMLFLRLIVMLGLAGYVTGAAIALTGPNTEGMKALLFFCSLNFIINGVQSCRLIIERFPVLLPETTKDLYKNNFYMLTTHEFLKVYKLSHIHNFKKNETILEENKPVTNLLMIKSGNACIIQNGDMVTTLGPGFFIGEMSFLTNGLATATVKAASDELEFLAWQIDDLNNLKHKKPALYNKLKEAIAINLIKKLSPR